MPDSSTSARAHKHSSRSAMPTCRCSSRNTTTSINCLPFTGLLPSSSAPAAGCLSPCKWRAAAASCRWLVLLTPLPLSLVIGLACGCFPASPLAAMLGGCDVQPRATALLQHRMAICGALFRHPPEATRIAVHRKPHTVDGYKKEKAGFTRLVSSVAVTFVGY